VWRRGSGPALQQSGQAVDQQCRLCRQGGSGRFFGFAVLFQLCQAAGQGRPEQAQTPVGAVDRQSRMQGAPGFLQGIAPARARGCLADW